MFALTGSQLRHKRLIRYANDLIVDDPATVNGRTRITPADYIAYVFGRTQLRLDEAEAIEYLNAALVRRGLARLDTEPAA